MTRIQRQIFTRGAIVGALITVTVIAADISGLLAPVENWLYDFRARHFQFSTSKPTDQLVHVDIDDKSLDVTGVGTWPWPRAKLAAILDEMRLAGVKAVALDIIYSEPRETASATTQPAQLVNDLGEDDAALAASIAKLGCVVVPASAVFDPPNSSHAYRAMVDDLRADLELTEENLTTQLSSQLPNSTDLQRKVNEGYIEARKDGIYQRINQEMGSTRRSREELRSALLKSQQAGVQSPVSRAFNQQFDRWEAVQGLYRLGAPLPKGIPPLVQAWINLPPLPQYVRAAAATGFVDYKPQGQGVLRSIPLFADLDGHLMPQMGLSLALLTLGIKPTDVQISENSVVLPRGSAGSIVIPVHSEYFEAQGRMISTVFDIPWFGGQRWEDMYDWPSHARSAQHMGANSVWTAHETEQKIIRNNITAAAYLPALSSTIGISSPTTIATTAPMDDSNRYTSMIDRVLTEGADWEKTYKAMSPQDLDQDGRDFLEGMRRLRLVREENPKLAGQLREQRDFLKQQLAGKSVLVGRISTGFIDVVPTSLHPRLPGVVAHGVIFNAIMSGDFWTRTPAWVVPVITLILGMIAALLATWLSPLLGLIVTMMLAGGYLLFDSFVLFDRANLIVGMAGPLTVLATAWAGCTLNRIITEMGERARITKRLGSYVDPGLVSYVLEHPDQVKLEGETRELTVVFTDLAGFTSISEELGEKTVGLLNKYLGRMVPIINSRGGTVNKFLGDGIMFFFGAPRPMSLHAHEAVQTVLEMESAIKSFNEETKLEGLPALDMRVGISSGLMVVGDAGTSERSDYTVLGDIVNLGARLESANKVTGTRILVNDRTAELIRDRYLLRPIGALQVKGKAIWVMTYEPIAMLNEATEQQKKIVDMTGAMVDAFIPGDFEGCLVAADKFEAEFGPSPLAAIYREQCRHNIEKPPEAFDGRIELTEK